MNCSGGFAFLIDKATYLTAPLDGMAVALVGQNPDNTTMVGSTGNWNFAEMSIDEKAGPEQRKALEARFARAVTQRVQEKSAPPPAEKKSK